MRDVLRILPLPDQVLLVLATGATVLAALENAVSKYALRKREAVSPRLSNKVMCVWAVRQVPVQGGPLHAGVWRDLLL